MTRLRRRLSLFPPLLAVYLAVFTVLSLHPAAHNLYADIYEGHKGETLIINECCKAAPAPDNQQLSEENGEKITIGYCLIDDFLFNLQSTIVSHCPGCTIFEQSSLFSSREPALCFSEVIAHWSGRAPPFSI